MTNRISNPDATLLDNLHQFGYIGQALRDILSRNHIVYPHDFDSVTAKDLLELRGISHGRVEQIQSGLHYFGYYLRRSTYKMNQRNEPLPTFATSRGSTATEYINNTGQTFNLPSAAVSNTSELESKIDMLVEHLIEAQSTPQQPAPPVEFDRKTLEMFADLLGTRLGTQVGSVIVEHFAADEIPDAAIEQNMRVPYVTDPVTVGRTVVNTHIGVVQGFDNTAQPIAFGPQQFCIEKMMEYLIKHPLQPGARAWVAELTNIWAGPPIVD